jgi:hypothetical protein
LKWGVEVPSYVQGKGDVGESDEGGLKALDADLLRIASTPAQERSWGVMTHCSI